ncbi:MAG: tetratricopeptide repeat protein [Acidobacteria bacterium]|nr:tetratricopeptide repeat protein [Acidobacteriota bacterium]
MERLQSDLLSTRPTRPPSAAERWFRAGAELVRIGRYPEAVEPLEQALAYSVDEPNASYMRSLRSCYGIAVAMARGDVARGRRLCEDAIAGGPLDAELYVNLARVYLRAGRKDLAIEALETGRTMDSRHPGVLHMCAQLGQRKPPVFAFLDRGHPLNKYAGKLRHRLLA